MTQNDAFVLRSALRLGEYDPLPPAVVREYEQYTRIKHRVLPCDTNPDVLILLIRLAGITADAPAAVNPMQERIKRGEMVLDEPLLVKWRKDSKLAYFRTYSARVNKVTVVLDGEAVERNLDLDSVIGAPEPVEA